MNKPSGGKKRPKPKKRSFVIAEAVASYKPTSQMINPALRYTIFEMNHFRCFQSVTIEPFSRVNLITGFNGVGKTAVLEAIFLHIGALNPQLALKVNLWAGSGRFGQAHGNGLGDPFLAIPDRGTSQARGD